MRAPTPPRVPRTLELHGERREDVYAWLRVDNWREAMRDPSLLDARVRAYLEEENAHTEAAMAPSAALRETLIAEMRGRIKEDDASVPDRDGPFEYYVRYAEGGEHPMYCRRAGEAPRSRCCSTATPRRRARRTSTSGTASTAPTTGSSPSRWI